MSNLIPFKPQKTEFSLVKAVKDNKQSITLGTTVLFFLYITSQLQGISSKVEPVILRDTITIVKVKEGKVKTKVQKIYVNDTAPRTLNEVKKANPKEYIKKYAPFAIAEMHKSGVPASITLAQGLVESNAGTSYLAVSANNHFGIKCFSTKCKKGHCINRGDDTHKDFFRKFSSIKECYAARSEFLKKPRYKGLFKHGKNYKMWAYGLKSSGYATDRNYSTKLIKVIEEYKLYSYDYY